MKIVIKLARIIIQYAVVLSAVYYVFAIIGDIRILCFHAHDIIRHVVI